MTNTFDYSKPFDESFIDFVKGNKNVVLTQDKFKELLKDLDKLKNKLDRAEWTLKSIALNLTTDPKDMRVVIKDWCCDQECLNLVNKYFEGKEAK